MPSCPSLELPVLTGSSLLSPFYLCSRHSTSFLVHFLCSIGMHFNKCTSLLYLIIASFWIKAFLLVLPPVHKWVLTFRLRAGFPRSACVRPPQQIKGTLSISYHRRGQRTRSYFAPLKWTQPLWSYFCVHTSMCDSNFPCIWSCYISYSILAIEVSSSCRSREKDWTEYQIGRERNWRFLCDVNI